MVLLLQHESRFGEFRDCMRALIANREVIYDLDQLIEIDTAGEIIFHRSGSQMFLFQTK